MGGCCFQNCFSDHRVKNAPAINPSIHIFFAEDIHDVCWDFGYCSVSVQK